MTDPSPTLSSKNWLSLLKAAFRTQPKSLKDLTAIMKAAEAQQIIDQDTYKMIDGVLEISQLQVREIMVPRSQMVVLPIEEPLKNIVTIISEASHSRFPVIGENKDDVLGILLVKDFLKAYLYEDNKNLDLKTILRPAFFVPESKRLDTLLNEFKARHNHLAIVVDEYGGIAGLISIEDILEEIVGDIEDEFDDTPAEQIQKIGEDHYQVLAAVTLEDLNEAIGTDFKDEEVDTIGGLLTRLLGQIPEIGQHIHFQGWTIKALRSDSRRVIQIEMQANAFTPGHSGVDDELSD